MRLKHQMAMVAGLVILAGCSEKDPMTGTQQTDVPEVTKEPRSSASAPAAPSAPAPTPATPTPGAPAPPAARTDTGTAGTLTNTGTPAAK